MRHLHRAHRMQSVNTKPPTEKVRQAIKELLTSEKQYVAVHVYFSYGTPASDTEHGTSTDSAHLPMSLVNFVFSHFIRVRSAMEFISHHFCCHVNQLLKAGFAW